MLDDIGHQYRQKFRYSINASGKGTVLGSVANRLASFLRLFYPLSSYRVYDVEHAQFMRSRSFLEMCKDFLD
jgi:hypothetical protein